MDQKRSDKAQFRGEEKESDWGRVEDWPREHVEGDLSDVLAALGGTELSCS